MKKAQTRQKTWFLMILLAIFTTLCSFVAGCSPTESSSSTPSATVSISKSEIVLDLYDTYTLTATKENTDAEIVWASSDTSVATVSDGEVRALAVGTVTITASAGEASAQCTVTVTNSQTAPVLDVDNVIAVGLNSEYPLSVQTKWKGEPIDEAVTYSWETNDANAASVATITPNADGSVATFKGVAYGSTSYTVSATVRGMLLVKTVVVEVRNPAIRYEFDNLTLEKDAYVASLSLKDTDGVDMGLTVYNNDAPVANPAIEYTYFDNGNAAGTATSEVISITDGKIVALKAGSVEVHGTCEGNGFRLRITTYRPEIELAVSEKGNDYLTIETMATSGETLKVNVTVDGLARGEKIEKLLVNGFDAYKSHTVSGYTCTFTLNKADLPQKGEDMGMKTVTVVTDKANYVAKAFVVTLIINNAVELENFDEIALEVGNATCLWDGYYALGNDIAYNKVYPAFFYYGKVKTQLDQDWLNGHLYGFRGVFDGQGYNIDGMELNQSNGAFIGLLHDDGVIKNVSFTNGKLTANGGAFLVNGGGGTIENVYVQLVEHVAGPSNSNKNGILFGRTLTSAAKVSKVFIETAIAAGTLNAYTIGSNITDSGIYNDVYAVGAVTPMNNVNVDGGGVDVYGSYKNYGELIAADIDFSWWTDDFWTVIGGLPYPKNLPAPGAQSASGLLKEELVEYTSPGRDIELAISDYKTVTTISANFGGDSFTLTSNASSVVIDVPANTTAGTELTVTVQNAYDSTVSKTFTVTVVNGGVVNLDEIAGFIKPVIEAGRFIASNRSVKSDAYLTFDMNAAASAFGSNIDAYDGAKLTIGGVVVGNAAIDYEAGKFMYSPNALIAALKNLSLGYGDDVAAEIIFTKGTNGVVENIVEAQFSVDVVGMLIKNADDLDFMLTAAQGLCYTGYENYGGFNGSAGNALGVYKLANDVYYKESNAAREYSAQYLTRIKLNSSFNNPKFYPVAMKDDQPGGFQGTFDGCGHVIYDLEFAEECFGLLGGTVGEHTVIKNVAFVNAKHDGWYAPLGLHQYGGTIQDVYMQIDMKVKTDNDAPSLHIWPKYEDYPDAGFKASEENTPTSQNAKTYRRSAAIVSYTQGGSALSRAPKNERIIVEYLNYEGSTSLSNYYGYPFGGVDISTKVEITLKNIYAVGTLPHYNLTSPEKQAQRFKDSGAYATTADLKAASIDFTSWEGDFWTVKDGVPTPKGYAAWTGVVAA